QTTPETYLGTARAQGWLDGPVPGLHDYGQNLAQTLPLNEFVYSGRWNIGAQAATAQGGAGIDLAFQARHAYLVLTTPGERRLPVSVLLDGRSISGADAGADVHHGVVTVH